MPCKAFSVKRKYFWDSCIVTSLFSMLCFYQNPAGERVRKHDKDENQIKENESQKKNAL